MTEEVSAQNKILTESRRQPQLPYLFFEKYIPSLDGLRAFSIILVLISHVTLNLHNPAIEHLNFGGFGVDIFFVISGFLITFLTLKEREKSGSISVRNFYIRRFLRIIPVAYLFIFVLLILNYIFKLHLASGTFLRPLVFCENFVDRPDYTLTGHYWTLSTEEQFYLLFPLLIYRSTNFFLKFLLFLFVFTPLITYIFFHFAPSLLMIQYLISFGYRVFGPGMLCIAVGCLTAILFFKFPNKVAYKFKNPTIVQLFLLLLAWTFNFYRLPVAINTIMSSLCTACLLISVINNRNNIVFKILNIKAVRYIGTLSYSIYIWQQIFCYHQPWANTSIPGKSIPINLVLLLITAMLSYHLYEKQFLKLKKSFHKK